MNPEPHRFTGQEYEPKLGLIYMGGRWYCPDTGRFLQVDAAREFWNSYSYVGNNPVMGIDPTGLSSFIFLQDGQFGNYFNDITFEEQRLNDKFGSETFVIQVVDTNEAVDILSMLKAFDEKIDGVSFMVDSMNPVPVFQGEFGASEYSFYSPSHGSSPFEIEIGSSNPGEKFRENVDKMNFGIFSAGKKIVFGLRHMSNPNLNATDYGLLGKHGLIQATKGITLNALGYTASEGLIVKTTLSIGHSALLSTSWLFGSVVGSSISAQLEVTPQKNKSSWFRLTPERK